MKIKLLSLIFIVSVVQGQNYRGFQKSQYIPVIKNGVPEDTPEVQAAKAAHFEAYERAKALAAKKPSNGQYEENSKYQKNQNYIQPYQEKYQNQNQPFQNAYNPRQEYQNVIYFQPRENYPVNTYSPAHFETPTQHYRYRRTLYEGETPEVQIARYQHHVAHATAHSEDDDDYYYAPHEEDYHIPIMTKKGVPSNTAAVKAARQKHLLAHELAKSGIQTSGGHSLHEPVIGPNGVPYDTPEVHLGKVQHYQAHAEESNKQTIEFA